MEQFRIAIVEDEAPHAELLKQHIESWRRQQGMVELHVQHFCHASAFLFEWEEACYDMIFLDIQMPGINGMETAHKIRETDSGVKLVFTTGITDYLEEGYEVEAVRYLLKPITQEKVWQCLDKLLQEPPPVPQHLFQTRDGMVKISEQEIEYLEARGHYTVCHLTGRASRRLWETADGMKERTQGEAAAERQAGKRLCEGTSQGAATPGKQVEKRLCEGTLQNMPREILLWEGFNDLCRRLSQRPFIRCHRSYLCSIAHIYRVERTDILLENGGRIPVSRRLYEPVVKAFISYFRKERSDK